MTQQVKAEFQVTRGGHPVRRGHGVAKLTEPLVTKEYSGDIEATSTTKLLTVTRRTRWRCSSAGTHPGPSSAAGSPGFS